jgi:hypothetical protein
MGMPALRWRRAHYPTWSDPSRETRADRYAGQIPTAIERPSGLIFDVLVDAGQGDGRRPALSPRALAERVTILTPAAFERMMRYA